MDSHHKFTYLNHLPKRFKTSEKKRIPVKKRGVRSKKGQSLWAFSVTVISFFLSIGILFLTSGLFERIPPFFSFAMVMVIVLVGVTFDMIGVAVTAAEEKPFHAMAAKKYKGAGYAISLIRKADKVASVCNDVVGDICGVVSGTAGAAILFRFFSGHARYGWIEAVVGGFIAAITVGGKAFAKNYGIKDCHLILYRVGTLIAFFIPTHGKRQ